MGILSALGTGLMGFLNTNAGASIAGTLAGTATNAIANSIGNSLNKSSSSQAEMGTTTNQNAASSAGWMNSQQAGGSEYSETQQGSVQGIANALAQALGTATGNNANTAATFGQMSAQTANNLQSAMWAGGNVLNVASNILTNILNAESQSSAKRYNEKQSEIAREFSREMRATAHQDTVNDLKAAGLNPILSATQGANGNYTGAEASVGAQGYTQAATLGVPTAHTSTMQAMYDYGNNTAQFVDNMLATINNAKQMGYGKEANWLEQAMSEGTQSSAKTISDYANSSTKSSFDSARSSGQTDSSSNTKSKELKGSFRIGK